MEKEPNHFASKKTIAIIIYIVVFAFLSSFIIMGLGAILSVKNGISFSEVLPYYQNITIDNPKAVEIGKLSYTIGEFLVYLLLFILIGFFMKEYLIEDFKKSKTWKFLITVVVLAAAFYLINYLLSLLIDTLQIETSENQNTIVGMIETNPTLTFISVVIFAPFVEELIYRKAIFEYFPSKPWLAFIVSTLLFALPHMLSTQIEVWKWCVLFLDYALCGALLCSCYYFTNKNIWVSIIVHMISNLLTFIFMVV